MNRITLTLLILLVVGLGLWAVFQKKPNSSARPSRSDTQSSQSGPKQSLSGWQSAQAFNAMGLAGTTTIGARTNGSAGGENPTVSQDVLNYVKNLQTDPEYDWKQPINFYGSVLDENDQPLSGANASFEWTDLSHSGTSKEAVVSDEKGLFALKGRQGKRLIVQVAKDGFYSSGNARGAAFEYANPGDSLFVADAAHPVVFHLRKKGLPAQLIHGLKLFGSRVDGTPSYVDLVTAKNGLTPPGDLIVQCTRSALNADKKFDWTFTLVALDGGIVESAEEFMLSAPTSGYQPSFQITHRIGDPDWTGQERHKFYVMSQNGQHYARVEITIIPDYNQNVAYDLDWFLNPKGSPNLESAPDTTTYVQ